MKKVTALLAVLTLSACGGAAGPAGVHAGDEIEWEEPAGGGSDEPVIHTATVTGWSGDWIECSDDKRIDADTFASLRVSCPHE